MLITSRAIMHRLKMEQALDITAIYPGTFDPVTKGHIDVACRAAKMFDTLIIGVAASPGKKPFFTLDERTAMAGEILADQKNIRIEPFSGLLVKTAVELGASVIVRGLRAVSDFEYEVQLANLNRQLNPDVETAFVAAASQYTFVSSSIVREIAGLGGDVSQFVHPIVDEALKKRRGS